MIVKIFLKGVLLLVFALVINGLASILKLKTWYDFVKGGFKASIIDLVFLFLVYPLLLGLCIFIINRITI